MAKTRQEIRKYMAEYRKRNRERIRKYRREYRLLNSERMRAVEKAYIQRNLERHRKYRREWQRQRQPEDRARVRMIVRQLKDVPCVDCGKRFPWYVMDFDHVRGRKITDIGSMGNSLTPDKILKEAKKCDVVCACCHRIRTYITRKKKH